MTKYLPSTLLTNDITFEWSALLWLVKRSVDYDGRHCVVKLYARTPEIRKELKWPRIKAICRKFIGRLLQRFVCFLCGYARRTLRNRTYFFLLRLDIHFIEWISRSYTRYLKLFISIYISISLNMSEVQELWENRNPCRLEGVVWIRHKNICRVKKSSTLTSLIIVKL